MTQQVLLVEDDTDFRAEVRSLLEAMGYGVLEAPGADRVLQRLQDAPCDLVLTDIRMRGISGTELCTLLSAHLPEVPVIVMTGFGSIELAVENLRQGAFDFLPKPFSADQLRVAVTRALHHRAQLRELRRLREDATRSEATPLLGESAPMKELRDLIGRVARSDASVLVEGESGTGKELVARAIHELGPRREGPFVAINCAAIPESLLESELFGYKKGAFTDAKGPRRGLLLEASGGTLFLDEIGEMPSTMQAKLLRALEMRRVRPLGSHEEVAFDARLVTASHRNLEERVQEGLFREDLLYRIQVVHLHVPPLRRRGRDVLLLAQRFLAKSRTPEGLEWQIGPDVAEKLMSYPWPGNVRELQNAVERATALASEARLRVTDLPAKVRDHRSRPIDLDGSDGANFVTLEEMERQYVLRVLDAVSQSKTAATRILGIDRSTLYRKMERYGLVGTRTGSSPPTSKAEAK